MTFFEQLLKKGFDVEAKEYQTDMSFTYLEDQEGTEYRMNIDDDELIAYASFREPGKEDWLDLSYIEITPSQLKEAV